MKFFAAFLLGIIILSASAYAAPSLFDTFPRDKGFVRGESINFSVNVSSANLNTSSATVFVISQSAHQQGENWDSFTMQCISYAQDAWKCSRTVSFAIAGSDTPEFFYFSATDASMETGSLGTSSSPLAFTLDRNPPKIEFVAPKAVYVSGNVTVQITSSDTASGVNESSLQFSLNNMTWNNMTNSIGAWNSTAYANNASVTIYVALKDNVGNSIQNSTDVRVDNEAPKISVISPSNGSAIAGSAVFEVQVSDKFSGVNTGNVKLYFISQNYPMSCAGSGEYNCSSAIDTSIYADNAYNITFTVVDNAGNSNSSSISVTLKNSKPVVDLQLSEGSYLGGVVSVNVSINKPEGIITNVSLETKNGVTSAAIMSCNSGFTLCSYLLDTRNFGDGLYTLTATAANTLGYSLMDSAKVGIDNTGPSISISAPDVVRGKFNVNATVADANPKRDGVTYRVDSSSQGMSCTPQGNTLTCTAEYSSLSLRDGLHAINVTAVDQLGNSFTRSRTIISDNDPPNYVFLKIEPIQSASPNEVRFTAGLNDTGSGVKYAKATIKHADFSAALDLVKASELWYGKATIVSRGPHNVGIITGDNNDNSILYENRGYFFIGDLQCGDRVCQPGENYCSCADDCPAPSCSQNQAAACGSGIPLCASSSCGDKICSGSESCASCGPDCGSCASIKAADSSIKATTIGAPSGPDSTKTPSASGGIGEMLQPIINVIAADPLTSILIVAASAIAIIITVTVIRERNKPEPFIKARE